MPRIHTMLSLLTSCSMLALAGSPAHAADPSAATSADTSQGPTARFAPAARGERKKLEEIYVTAQRRRQRVIDVPISVAVVSQSQLRQQDINDVIDLNKVTPSLDILQQGSGAVGGGGSVRGIGTVSANAGAVASVGIVVDQVSQGNANLTNLFDVARIEVLKGPQGTLFGLTTSAGVINITTNAPDPRTYSGEVRTQLSAAGIAGSHYGDQLLQAYANVPLTTQSAVRVSIATETRQGPDRDAYTNGASDVDSFSGRARYLWKNHDWTINVIGDYTHGYTTNNGDFLTLIQLPPDAAALVAGCGITAKVGNAKFCNAQQYQSHYDNYGLSVEADYSLGGATLSSISAYRGTASNSDGQDIFRADPLPLRVIVEGQPTDINLFSQEFRIASPAGSRLEYVLGTYASAQVTGTLSSPQDVSLGVAPGVRIPLFNSKFATNHVNDNSVAMYAQSTYHLTKQLGLIAGARITGAELKLKRFDSNANVGSNINYSTVRISVKAGLQYELPYHIVSYATFSRGYKGAQIALPSLPLLPYLVKPEVPTDYEIGLKKTLFGGMLLDVNLFHESVQNYQTQKCVFNAATQTADCAQANISQVVSKGAEVDLFGRVSDALSLSTGVIYQSVTYPNGYLGSDGSDLSNQQLALAPKWKITFAGEYDQPITERVSGFLSIDAVYKSRTNFEAKSYPGDFYRGHVDLGARIGARLLHDQLTAFIFTRNLLNEHEPSSLNTGFAGFPGPTSNAAVYGPNAFRQVGLGLEMHF